jgi:hypothetical protein
VVIAERALLDLALGTIAASTLHLSVIADAECVPLVFGLLQRTSFPRLQCLFITLDNLDTNTLFDPLRAPSGSVHNAQQWSLDHSLASRLSSVHISLPLIDTLANATGFFELFGAANRPGVLRVLTERVHLVG